MTDQPLNPPAEPLAPGIGPFPPEIWREIFSHARQPIPAPLSRPKRSELRQQTLTVLARTCKLFHDLVIPLLYRTVITDRFGDFATPNPNHHPRYALVETLYIEYQNTDVAQTYHHLLRDGRAVWDSVAPSAEQAEKLQMERCQEEVTRLFFTVMGLSNWGTDGESSFPRLRKVSVGSIYGHQGDLWSRFDRFEENRQGRRKREKKWGDLSDMPGTSSARDCRDFWEAFLRTTRVSHICIRDPSAPLGFSHRPHASSTPFAKTIHFAPDTPGLGLQMGQNPTWVSEVPQDQPFNPIWVAVRNSVRDLTVARAKTGGAKPGRFYQVDIYGSTRYIGDPDPNDTLPIYTFLSTLPGIHTENIPITSQRIIAKAMGDRMSAKMLLAADRRDNIDWFPSHDYPGCKSCGSGPPL